MAKFNHSEEVTDETIMPWGAQKGKKMSEVPDAYLLWLWNNKQSMRTGIYSGLFKYIESNLDSINYNLNKNGKG